MHAHWKEKQVIKFAQARNKQAIKYVCSLGRKKKKINAHSPQEIRNQVFNWGCAGSHRDNRNGYEM